MAGNGGRRAESAPKGRDLEVVTALVAGYPNRAVADKVGISERTVERTRAKYADLIRDTRNANYESNAAILNAMTPQALRVLNEVMTRGTPRDAVRLAAARATLDYALKYRDQVTLANEVAELRDDVDALPTKPTFGVVR